MEKFGIFELLDALSALTAAAETGPAPDDAAYRPPDYAPPPPANGETRDAERGEALSSFLARHDAIARKIDRDKKNPP